MKHIGTQELETERLILRKFEISDAENMFKNWSSDSEVTKFLTWETHKSIDDSKEIISFWIHEYDKPDFYQWAIVLKDIKEPIGSISVVGKNEKLGIVHIGYCIGSKWWNQGLTTEAFQAIIPFFFKEVGVNRIESQHDPNNPNSGRVMKKCGLRYEGTLRQADWSNKGIVDACMYSLLKSEWGNE